MRLAFALVLAACGSSSPRSPSGAPASTESTRAAADDVIVAQVNGHPVWGSCVAAQSRRARGSGEAATRDDALHQCIDFELMAQAAEHRGFATHPDVIDATRTAMVSQLVAHVYEDGFQNPGDFGGNWQRLAGASLWRVQHEEYRASSYVRITLPETATPAQIDAAKQTMDRVAAALANEHGLLGPQLVEIAQQAAGPTKLDHQDVPPFRIGGFDDQRYGDALFGIAELGRTSPATRTKWGFDIIAWTDDVPATSPSEDEIVAKLLPEVKRGFFITWVNRITRDLGAHVELFQDNLAKLDPEPESGGLAPTRGTTMERGGLAPTRGTNK